MRKFFAVLVILCLIFTACSDLPPEPGNPGEGDVQAGVKTGAATYVPAGYAPPEDIFNNDKQIFSLDKYVYTRDPTSDVLDVGVDVSHANALVYKYGYYFSQSKDKWVKYELSGNSVAGSNWLMDNGQASLNIPLSDLSAGKNYVLAYSCQQIDNRWRCGCRDESSCGFWMLNTFIYNEFDLPPEPSDPNDPMRVDLPSYPKMFIKDNKFNGVIVVGDNAAAEDVVSASDIAMSLQYNNIASEVVNVEIGAVRLASEIQGMEKNLNLILIGTPCANAAVEAASAAFPTCAGWPLVTGEGTIQILEQPTGKIAMLVAGTNSKDTRAAASVVAEMDKLKQLEQGTTRVVTKVISGEIFLTDWPEEECTTDEQCGVREPEVYCSDSGDACQTQYEARCRSGMCTEQIQGTSCMICQNGCQNGACLTGPRPTDTYKFSGLNLYEDLKSITRIIDGSDIALLGEKIFSVDSTPYREVIETPAGEAMVKYMIDADYSGDPDVFLAFSGDPQILEYDLIFDNPVASDIDSNGHLEDIEDRKIMILGKEYTITDAKVINNMIKLTLFGGSVQDTLEVGQSKTYTLNGNDYEVTVLNITQPSVDPVVKFIVNDEVTDWLSMDDTYTLKDGTVLGTKELPTKSGDVVQDLVEFYLGANKIVLDGSDSTVDINENTAILDTFTDIEATVSATEAQLKGIEIRWRPTEEMSVPVGSRLSDSAANVDSDYEMLLSTLGVDYHFPGFESVRDENIDFRKDRSYSYDMIWTNLEGTQYTMPLFYYNGSSGPYLGDEPFEDLKNEEGTDVKVGQWFVVEDANYKLSKVYALENIKQGTTNEVTLRELGGSSFSVSYDPADGFVEFEDWTLKVTGSNVAELYDIEVGADDGKADIWTRLGSKIVLNGCDQFGACPTVGNAIQVQLPANDDGSVDVIALDPYYDGMNANLKLFQPIEDIMLSWDTKQDYMTGVIPFGAMIEKSTRLEQTEFSLEIPEKQHRPIVFFGIGDICLDNYGNSVSCSSGGSGGGSGVYYIGDIFKGGTTASTPFQWNEEDEDTLAFMQADANGDTVVTGEELCQSMGLVCAFTQRVVYNVDSNRGNIAEVAGPTIGCYGGLSFEELAGSPMRGTQVKCITEESVGDIFKEGGYYSTPYPWNEEDEDTLAFMQADANGDTVVTGEELCASHGQSCVWTQRLTYNVDSNRGNIAEVAGPTIGCYGGLSFEELADNPMRGTGVKCVTSAAVGDIFKSGRMLSTPYPWNEEDEDTLAFMQADANGDTVVTGEELCQANDMTCVFTQRLTYNVDSNRGNIAEVAGPTIGCYGGLSFEDLAGSPMRGTAVKCVNK